jgi:TolB-like protein/tRNA A-37 threonylcarbamoyl transferase component Bud32/Flp pilus assembly protein TadD
MGEVYKARDTRLGREVAIKVLPAEFAADPDRLRRFEQEARAVAALDHPNILAIHDVGSHEGAPFIVTELLEGETLQDRLKAGGLTVSKAVEVAVQIAQGLSAAHAKGIIHRDLKPGNVFLARDGHVKILDFGIAKLLTPKSVEELARETTMVEATAAGTVLGTVGYMAPEQIRGHSVDFRTDIFALGCVVYEMLAGRLPFSAATDADTVAAILSADPRPLAEAGTEIPQGLEAIVLRCLEKRPEDRFTSPKDVAFALLAFAGSRETSGRATFPRELTRDDRPSAAVLPFVNLSADPEQEYFCHGMAEEIINALAHVRGLRVIARTSSFAFKGRAEDVREIGAQLDVATLLEGSVRRSGDRLRITAQLINVADGSHLWSERYDRRLEDVFAIQEEIALAIVESLQVHLLGRERAAIARRPTENLDAHSAYLRGQFHWNTFTADGFARSRESFEEAIRIDPNYAPALGGLGMWYVSQAFWADFPSEEAWREASAMAERALSSEPEYWLAYTVRGNLLANFERRWAEAEESLRKGVLYGPSQAQAHFNLGALLVVRRRWKEVAEEARLALRLDPLSAPNCAWNAAWLNAAGHGEEAGAELEKIVAIDPNHWLPHWGLAMLAAGKAHLDQARRESEKAVELSGRASMAVTLLACTSQALCDERRAGQLEEELRERAHSGHVAPTLLAWIADSRRNAEAAVAWLERAAATRDPMFCFYRTMPATLVSGDPAIEALLRRFDL